MLSKFLDCPIESRNDRYGSSSDRYESGSDRCGRVQAIFSFDPRIEDCRGSLIKAAELPKASIVCLHQHCLRFIQLYISIMLSYEIFINMSRACSI